VERPVALVLGGGGHAGAHARMEMLHALLDRDVNPDLIAGTSVGALHGALVAAEPTTVSVGEARARLVVLSSHVRGTVPVTSSPQAVATVT